MSEPPLDPPEDQAEECPECDTPLNKAPWWSCPSCGWEPTEPDYAMLENPDA